MFGEPTDRGDKERRRCNHCGRSYVHIYSDDDSDSKYCDSCAEKYHSFKRISQVMNYDQQQLTVLSELIDGEPYELWVDEHPPRAYLFDARTVEWDADEFADVRGDPTPSRQS